MYTSGLRVYLLDNYNIMDFILLSLYMASYMLRFLVDHLIKQEDDVFDFTKSARAYLLNCSWTGYEDIVKQIDSSNWYFMKACMYYHYG